MSFPHIYSMNTQHLFDVGRVLHNLLFFVFFTVAFNCFFTVSNAAKLTQPTSFLLPIKKDHPTLQYLTSFHFGSGPPVNVHAVVDIGGQFLWINCDDYQSSTYQHVPCDSQKCENFNDVHLGCYSCGGGPLRPGCTNDTCGVFAFNPINGTDATGGYVGEDVLALNSVDGTRLVSRVPFAYAHTEGLVDLAKTAQGMLGLAKTSMSLTTYIPNSFNIPKKMAVCLPKSGFGSWYIGDGPYNLPKHLSNLPIKTALVTNPVRYYPRAPADEYFINVTSIDVDGEAVSFDKSLLVINNKDGIGGTKISTINSYTVLHTSIYKVVIRSFNKKASDRKIKKVTPVAPFGTCFSSKSIRSAETGPAVPQIDLVLEQFKTRYWRIWGANSMVKVSKDVMCLGFVDGGKKPETSIVIGGLQLENCLLEVDLESSTVGLTPPLVLYNSSCSHEYKGRANS